MLTRLIAMCGAFGAILQVCLGASLTANQYLALRKSLGATSALLAAAKSNPSAYIGKAFEVKGIVNGVAQSGDSASFLVNCSGDSLLVAAQEVPDCMAQGNRVRIIVEIGPGSVASLSDLKLVGAAYEYEVEKLEKELISKASNRETKPAVQKKLPTRATVQLSSRGKSLGLSSRALEVFDAYRNAIHRFNPRLNDRQLDTITASILAYSEHYGVDPRLIVALILVESGFRTGATSSKGAMGLGQLMPGTARGLGVVNPYDPVQNIAGCIRLMRGHLEKEDGDLQLALACYNAGSGAVKKYGGIPPYRETQDYVRKVTWLYMRLCGK